MSRFVNSFFIQMAVGPSIPFESCLPVVFTLPFLVTRHGAGVSWHERGTMGVGAASVGRGQWGGYAEGARAAISVPPGPGSDEGIFTMPLRHTL